MSPLTPSAGLWMLVGVVLVLALLAFVLRRSRDIARPRSAWRAVLRIAVGVMIASTVVISGLRSADRGENVGRLPTSVDLVTHAYPDAPIDRIQFMWVVTDRSGSIIVEHCAPCVLQAGEASPYASVIRDVLFRVELAANPTSLADVRTDFSLWERMSGRQPAGSGGAGLVLPAGDAGLPFDVLKPSVVIRDQWFDPIAHRRTAMILARPLRRGETLESRPAAEFRRSISAALARQASVDRAVTGADVTPPDPLARLLRQTNSGSAFLLAFGVLLACFCRRMPLTSACAALMITLTSMGTLIRIEHRRHEHDIHDAQSGRAIAALVGLAGDVSYPSAAGRAADDLLGGGAADEVKIAALWAGANGDAVIAASPEMAQAIERASHDASAPVREAAEAIRKHRAKSA